jgi:hypothetical protein
VFETGVALKVIERGLKTTLGMAHQPSANARPDIDPPHHSAGGA